MANKTLKFEDKMNRLNSIVEKLENDNTEIDEAIKLYEEGLNLSNELKTQLKVFEEKVKKISKEK